MGPQAHMIWRHSAGYNNNATLDSQTGPFIFHEFAPSAHMLFVFEVEI